MAAVRIGPKYQVTIPQRVREAVNLRAGDFLEAAAEGGRIVLTPLQPSAKADLRAGRVEARFKVVDRIRRRVPSVPGREVQRDVREALKHVRRRRRRSRA